LRNQARARNKLGLEVVPECAGKFPNLPIRVDPKSASWETCRHAHRQVGKLAATTMMSTATPVALVTGAGSGLGRALAHALAADGHAIAAIDVRADGLAELERELPGRVAWATADVSDAAALALATVDLERRLGPTDLLIANAGIGFETSALNF